MEEHIPTALRFSHAQRYVKLPPGQVIRIVVIQGSPRKEGAVNENEMANLAWEACIKDCITMGEFQEKLFGTEL